MTEVFAKSKNQESIAEHTSRLLKNYEYLKQGAYLDSEKIRLYDQAIKKILWYHDLGKLNHKFQNKIRKILGYSPIKLAELSDYHEIPHEWLSVAFISKSDQNFFKSLNQTRLRFTDLVRYCIAFHHTRSAHVTFDKEAFENFVCLDLEKSKGKLGINFPLNPYCNIENIRRFVDDHFRDYFPLLIFIKGILHKCDYSASADVPPEKPYQGDYQKDFQTWLTRKGFTLRNYQQEAKALSDKNLIFIASTGAGKTEYAINWLNGDKGFYLLGIRTAVNAMFERFKQIFGEENTSLLHGETSYFLADETEDESTYLEKLAKARQLSYPITVATADQLVTSVFKYNTFELPYLTASYSKIVVDEIQSFAPEAIAATVTFLKEIHELGGKFLLMTATLPPFIKNQLQSLEETVVPKPALTRMKRHRIQCLSQPIEAEETIAKIQTFARKNKKILLICNTVRKVQALYKKLRAFKPKLLHSQFINKDRREKENQIIAATKRKSDKSCIWITTQIVEASLDIDFDLLFTECATIESILQRFGRCFRQRDYSEQIPNIFICPFDKSTKLIYDPELMGRTWEILQSYDCTLLSEQDKHDMVEKVFQDIEDTRYYQKFTERKELLAFGIRTKSKSEAQQLFRNILNNYVVIPDPVYKTHQKTIESLIKAIDSPGELLEKIKEKRELLKYSFPAQIYQTKQSLLKEIDSVFCRRNQIFRLAGVEYSKEVGMAFLEDYKDYDNFIL